MILWSNESFRIGYIDLDKEMEGNLVNRIYLNESCILI